MCCNRASPGMGQPKARFQSRTGMIPSGAAVRNRGAFGVIEQSQSIR